MTGNQEILFTSSLYPLFPLYFHFSTHLVGVLYVQVLVLSAAGHVVNVRSISDLTCFSGIAESELPTFTKLPN